MKKAAEVTSIIFHPVLVSFFNFLFILLNIGNHGAVVGFTLMLFLFFTILIPTFYTFLIVYLDKRNFNWIYFTEMEIEQRTKILAISVIHYLIFLFLVANLNFVFLGNYNAMICTLIMGMVVVSLLSFVSHFFNLKNSLHALSLSFFVTFYIIFLWQIPGLGELSSFNKNLLYTGAASNFLILIPVSISRIYLKSHDRLEIAAGIFIGIISPIVLTLLSYGL